MIVALCELNEKLSALVADYPRFGQTRTNVDTVLSLSSDGRLKGTISLAIEKTGAKGKTRIEYPSVLVPFRENRTSGTLAYFLCDKPEYILGFNKLTGEMDRSKFDASAELHHLILDGVDSPCAKGILAFFDNWNPEAAITNPDMEALFDNIGNWIVFRVDDVDALDDKLIWDKWYKHFTEGLGEPKLCSVLGEMLPATKNHPKIRNVRGGSSSGSSLVSFNNEVFESFGLGGNDNAVVSTKAAFAYTTALNYLLSDARYRFIIGKSTFVCWADSGNDAYSGFFMNMLNSGSVQMDMEKLQDMMTRIGKGRLVDFNEAELDSNSDFHILGLSPNNGRLSVSFYCHNSFGWLLANLVKHYERLSIVGMNFPSWPYSILNELLISDKDLVPDWLMAGFLSSILNNSLYPEAVYTKLLSRIAADGKLNSTRVGMIKAFLLQNSTNQRIEEVALMNLNNQSDYQPYVLGRLFAVLSRMQKSASDVTSIRDKYFDSACSTPAVAFPSIMLLAEKHQRKLERDKVALAKYYETLITEIISLLNQPFPAHLTLEEQGVFIIGFYHQNNSMNKKKEDNNECN